MAVEYRSWGGVFDSGPPFDTSATGPGGNTNWTATDWITWHKNLVAADPTTANSIFCTAWMNGRTLINAYGNEWSIATHDTDFQTYCISVGLDKSCDDLASIFSDNKVIKNISDTVDNVSQLSANASAKAAQSANSWGDFVKYLPWIVLGLGLMAGVVWFYWNYGRKKA